MSGAVSSDPDGARRAVQPGSDGGRSFIERRDGSARLARCYGCGHESPWDRSVEDLRKAKCSKCGGRGACLALGVR